MIPVYPVADVSDVLASAAVRHGVHEVLGQYGPGVALVAATVGVAWLGFRRG